MKGFIRLFPLNWVIFPEEVVNLHIFEPRYRELITDCQESGEPFGIPFFDSGIQKFGTLLKLDNILKRYQDGKMDISATGIEPFELLKFNNLTEGKLYPSGTIKTIPINYHFDEKDALLLQVLIEKFFNILGMRPKVKNDELDKLSFLFGHKIGLSQKKELELLLLQDEYTRQQFLIDHLEATIPTMEQLEVAKHRIKLNGHFKTFDPLEF